MPRPDQPCEVVIESRPIGPGMLVARWVTINGQRFEFPKGTKIEATTEDSRVLSVTLTLLPTRLEFRTAPKYSPTDLDRGLDADDLALTPTYGP